jgi:hypothetical protein
MRMAQRMIDLAKIKKSIATQTGESANFYISLSKTKHASLKYSTSYKDTVLSFNINSSKSFIITRQMWKIFKKHITLIDNELGK